MSSLSMRVSTASLVSVAEKSTTGSAPAVMNSLPLSARTSASSAFSAFVTFPSPLPTMTPERGSEEMHRLVYAGGPLQRGQAFWVGSCQPVLIGIGPSPGAFDDGQLLDRVFVVVQWAKVGLFDRATRVDPEYGKVAVPVAIQGVLH